MSEISEGQLWMFGDDVMLVTVSRVDTHKYDMNEYEQWNCFIIYDANPDAAWTGRSETMDIWYDDIDAAMLHPTRDVIHTCTDADGCFCGTAPWRLISDVE